MKTIIASIIALAAVASLSAHCDVCSVGGKKGKAEEHSHASACSDTQLATYFEVGTGLANDNLVDAQKGAKALLDLAAEKGCSLDGDSCCAAEIGAADIIASTNDIAKAREAFKSWSDVLIGKVEGDFTPNGKIYKMHCPMAFGNKGASWLQGSDDLRNPYYGSMMLKCGFVKKTIEPKAE